MTDLFDIETEQRTDYPIRPDYDHLSFDRKPINREKRNQNDGKKHRNHEIIVLAVVAGSFFVASILALLLFSHGVIFRDDGHFVLGFWGGLSENPFELASANHEIIPNSEAEMQIDISNPPSQTTDDQNGTYEKTTKEIIEKVTPSVVAVLSSGIKESNVATGIILSSNGYIVTSASALQWSNAITVVLSTGERCRAVLVGMDAGTDIAVILIQKENLPNARFGNSDALGDGDSIMLFGVYPDNGIYLSKASGIVSSITHNLVRGGSTMSVIRSDTGYRTSFAGAPIVNRYGQVIGILSDAMSVPDQGFSVSVAMNSAKGIIENIVNCALEKTERTQNRDLGFEGVFMTDSMATANGSPVGMYVKSVVYDGILYRLGVCPGDVITSLNGVVLTDIKAFEKAVLEKTDAFSIVVYRDNDPNDEKIGEYLEMELA